MKCMSSCECRSQVVAIHRNGWEPSDILDSPAEYVTVRVVLPGICPRMADRVAAQFNADDSRQHDDLWAVVELL
jgi:hypothetical protein